MRFDPIQDERGLRLRQTDLRAFEAAIKNLKENDCPEDVHPVLHKAHIEGLESIAAELRIVINEYQQRTSEGGKVRPLQ